jgi:hypothetical protein
MQKGVLSGIVAMLAIRHDIFAQRSAIFRLDFRNYAITLNSYRVLPSPKTANAKIGRASPRHGTSQNKTIKGAAMKKIIQALLIALIVLSFIPMDSINLG